MSCLSGSATSRFEHLLRCACKRIVRLEPRAIWQGLLALALYAVVLEVTSQARRQKAPSCHF